MHSIGWCASRTPIGTTWIRRRESAGPRSGGLAKFHLWVRKSYRKALLIGDDLLERLPEIQVEVGPFGPAQMGRAEHVRHRQERMISVGDRLLLVDVDSSIAGPALAQCGQQGARLYELRPRGIHDQ